MCHRLPKQGMFTQPVLAHAKLKLYVKPGLRELRTLATDAACQLNVLGHDGDALRMDSAEVGVLKEAHEVCLGRLL